MAELHISSCIARVRVDALDAVIPAIEAIIGCAVSASDGAGRVVLVMEGPHTGALLDQMDEIRNVTGVMNVEMVYQHAEDETVMKELMP